MLKIVLIIFIFYFSWFHIL